MGFREDWQAWYDQQIAAFGQVLGQARGQRLGRRVWVWGKLTVPDSIGFPVTIREDWLYGEVAKIGGAGDVWVLRGYGVQDQPVYWFGKLADLGELVRLAE